MLQLVRFFVLSLVTGVAASAFAADIINKDTKTYKVTITCDGATTSATIGANTTQVDAVTKGCLLKLNNGGAYTVQGENKNVVIKGGRPHEVAPDRAFKI